MYDETDRFLEDIAGDMTQGPRARKLAEEMLLSWRSGIIPSRHQMKELRKEIEVKMPCKRLEPDGACAWLRRHAKLMGLHTPLPGQKAYCHRTTSGKLTETFEGCPGFSRLLGATEIDDENI